MEMLPQQFRTPEIYGDFWFNSDPITLGAMRGYVILIDFWDHTSYKCLQTLPYLREWYSRYAEKGLILIGVHTPEFPFARDAMSVRKAIERLGIRYPVVMDNDYLVWGAFRNQQWPAKYLIDKHGFIRYVHAGEGSYQNFEHALQSLIAETGYHEEFPIVMEPIRESDRPGAISPKATPAILAGWQRGTIGNVEGLVPESTLHFEDPGFMSAADYICMGTGSAAEIISSSRNRKEGKARCSSSTRLSRCAPSSSPKGRKNFRYSSIKTMRTSRRKARDPM